MATETFVIPDLNIPAGTKARWDSAAQKIVFDPIDSYPHSWNDFCGLRNTKSWVIHPDDATIHWSDNPLGREAAVDKAHYPTKDYAVASIAFAQLLSLRYKWLEIWSESEGLQYTWEPDWSSSDIKYCVVLQNTSAQTYETASIRRPLSFPEESMADAFITNFSELIFQAAICL